MQTHYSGCVKLLSDINICAVEAYCFAQLSSHLRNYTQLHYTPSHSPTTCFCCPSFSWKQRGGQNSISMTSNRYAIMVFEMQASAVTRTSEDRHRSMHDKMTWTLGAATATLRESVNMPYMPYVYGIYQDLHTFCKFASFASLQA